MLDALRCGASDRKLRLFAVACCRHIWELLPDPRSRAAVDAAERFADGAATPAELQAARSAATKVLTERSRDAPDDRFRFVLFAASDTAYRKAWDAASMMPVDAAWPTCDEVVSNCTNYDILAAQADLIRDIFGNPFSPAPIEPSWLTPAVVDMAQGIYADRAFARLPLLADALQAAGCENATILTHCRTTGPHVRGCWAVDLVTGRE